MKHSGKNIGTRELTALQRHSIARIRVCFLRASAKHDGVLPKSQNLLQLGRPALDFAMILRIEGTLTCGEKVSVRVMIKLEALASIRRVKCVIHLANERKRMVARRPFVMIPEKQVGILHFLRPKGWIRAVLIVILNYVA